MHVETRSETEAIDPSDPRADALMDAIKPFHGIVASGGDGWGVTITVDAPTPGAALELTADIIAAAVKVSGMPPWPYVRVELVREDEQQRIHDAFMKPGEL